MDAKLFNATREETVCNVTVTFVGDAQTHNALLGDFNNYYYSPRHGCTSHMNRALMVSTCSAFRLLGSVFM